MLTVSDVIFQLMRPLENIGKTVDTLKTGLGEMVVTGIATAFMPSYSVLSVAKQQDLNLVIAHEAPFYHHTDVTDHLINDSVYQLKLAFIQESNLAIFRLHDQMHRVDPDTIFAGLVRDLGWSSYVVDPIVSGQLPIGTYPLEIPAMSLGEVVEHVKNALNIPVVRVIGDLSMTASRIGILNGYRGGGSLAIPFFRNENLDLVICGEGPEWETPEYVRDAIRMGQQKALIVLGHGNSEWSGMKHLARTLKTMFPAIPVEFIPEEDPFQFL